MTTDQQLADRFGEFELPQWRNDASFAQLLKTFGAMFPLRAASDLCEPKIRQRILALTEGVTVRIAAYWKLRPSQPSATALKPSASTVSRTAKRRLAWCRSPTGIDGGERLEMATVTDGEMEPG